MVGFASPAAAQYYPNYGYGQNQGGNVVGQILRGVLGYGQYPYGNYGYNQVNQRQAVSQCARAVEARLNYSGGYGGYGGYDQGYGGYNQGYGYNQGHNGGRVLGVTRVERRNNGVRVRGVASSGGGYGGGYGGYGNNQGYGQADLSFNCRVDYRGRVVDIDLNRRNTSYGYRGY